MFGINNKKLVMFVSYTKVKSIIFSKLHQVKKKCYTTLYCITFNDNKPSPRAKTNFKSFESFT